MARPVARVRRGTGLYYYHDGVHAMTELGGGLGTILTNSATFDLPTIVLSDADFDAWQDYLEARDVVFAQQIADAVNGP